MKVLRNAVRPKRTTYLRISRSDAIVLASGQSVIDRLRQSITTYRKYWELRVRQAIRASINGGLAVKESGMKHGYHAQIVVNLNRRKRRRRKVYTKGDARLSKTFSLAQSWRLILHAFQS